MSILKQARLVEARKDGRWMYYRLAGKDAPREVRDAIAWVCRSVSASRKIREDAKRLKKILKLDPEKLCRAQSEK
jgi:DNA-binding transcriptional ArsR family regulator